MRGAPRVLSPFGELTDDADTGSSTEPTHDMYEDVRNHYRDVAHSIEHRLDRRARGVISHFIVERYRIRLVGRTLSIKRCLQPRNEVHCKQFCRRLLADL